MREKLETLSLVDLRAIAKENGIKNLTIMRKKEIIDRILEVTERKAAEKKANDEWALTVSPVLVELNPGRYAEKLEHFCLYFGLDPKAVKNKYGC